MKKPPPGLVTSRSKPPRRHHPHHHPHPQRHHPGHHPGRKPGPGGVRMTNPLLPGAPLPAHRHKAPKHKKAKKPVRRKLALGEGVACCAAEALAASLRLAGVPVCDEDVLALYWRTAADADAGASISATLEAASEFGLAGVRLSGFCGCQPVMPGGMRSLVVDDCAAVAAGDGHERAALGTGMEAQAIHGLILGVTLPGGPHALTLDPSGAVWSWGELHDPGDLDIEEAWTVDWEV